MAIARTTPFLLGTSETIGVTIAPGSSQQGTETDLLGNDTSMGTANVYLVFTSPSTQTQPGSIDVRLDYHPAAGKAYTEVGNTMTCPVMPGTNLVYLGNLFTVSRYCQATVFNNSQGVGGSPGVNAGVTLTNVALRLEVFAQS